MTSATIKPEFPSCLACVSYARYLMEKPAGGVTELHLCDLPADLVAAPAEDDQEPPYAADADGREYIGTICDQARRMGSACGPRAALWEPKA